MPTIGVNVAILQDGKVLLTRREDFEVWCLPGGGVEDGESLAQAARREAREETGLAVELTRLVGLYSRPQWRTESTHVVVFAARPVGGSLSPQASEVLEARFFSLAEVPQDLLADQRRRIEDALSGAGGSLVWLQDTPWPLPPDLSREEFYAQRDRSGASRRDFYWQYFGDLDPDREVLEVGVASGRPRLDRMKDGEEH
jgi:ADP-ribose pyrophosphatase YjhB (NUDIX family)